MITASPHPQICGRKLHVKVLAMFQPVGSSPAPRTNTIHPMGKEKIAFRVNKPPAAVNILGPEESGAFINPGIQVTSVF